MDPSALASGSITSRFESQSAIDEAKETRQREWKEAYAKIGQEPPPEPKDEEYDGRTLFERLQSQKDVKKEEWDNKMKLSNQWRGLDSEEQRFLAEKEAERRAAQSKLDQQEADELREYREKLAAKHSAAATDLPPPLLSSITSSTSSSSSTKKVPPKAARKDVKSLMKGVVVRKKPKPATTTTAPTSSTTNPASNTADSKLTPTKGTSKREAEDTPNAEGDDEKRRKLAT